VPGDIQLPDQDRNYFFPCRELFWGEVTAQLRTISVESLKATVKIYVYYYGPVPQNIVDDFDASVVSQIVADFPYPEEIDPMIEFEFARCDLPGKLLWRDDLVLFRKEE